MQHKVQGHYAFQVAARSGGAFEVQRKECKVCDESGEIHYLALPLIEWVV